MCVPAATGVTAWTWTVRTIGILMWMLDAAREAADAAALAATLAGANLVNDVYIARINSKLR